LSRTAPVVLKRKSANVFERKTNEMTIWPPIQNGRPSVRKYHAIFLRSNRIVQYRFSLSVLLIVSGLFGYWFRRYYGFEFESLLWCCKTKWSAKKITNILQNGFFQNARFPPSARYDDQNRSNTFWNERTIMLSKRAIDRPLKNSSVAKFARESM